jgi:hypothetical protein
MMQTLVTAIIDLASREPRRQSVDFYVDRLPFVLALGEPLVIFAEPRIASRVATACANARTPVKLVELALEALPGHARAEASAGLPTFLNADPGKDTVLYQALMWSKLDLVERAVSLNPFRTDAFGWIDAGIGYVAQPPDTRPAPATRLAALEMCATAQEEVEDRAAFYEFERGRLAGGFLRMSAALVPTVAAAWRDELSAALAVGRRPNEQQVLAALSARRPDLFELYPGDYASVICNWDHVRRDLETVLLNIRHCREWRLWSRALVLCERVATAVAAGVLSPSDEDRARWLDEYLVAALAAGDPPRAARVARQFLATCQRTTHFARHRERLLGLAGPLIPPQAE